MEAHRRFYSCTFDYVLTALLLTFVQEELVRSIAFRYITDVITPAEALQLLKKNAETKQDREAKILALG
jgi:L-fuconate dehydratase